MSGSVDGAEYRLQLDGLAAALTHPDVTDALLAAAGAPVSIAVYEWSGPTSQAVIVDWTEITDIAALTGVTARLRGQHAHPGRSVDGARHRDGRRRPLARPAARMLETHARHLRRRRVQHRTHGRRMSAAQPALADITINALVIGPEANDPSQVATGLLGYFEAYVIRGPDAFAEHAETFAAYEAAMVRKLLKELQGMVIGAVDPTGAAQWTGTRPGAPERPPGSATAPALSRASSPDPATASERTP